MPELKSSPDFGKVDLTDCDREPIHIPGQVQEFGCLIATTRDWIVSCASANCGAVLGREAEAILGQPLDKVLPRQTLHSLRTALQRVGEGTNSARLFSVDAFGDDRLFDISVHAQDNTFVIEFEHKPAEAERSDLSRTQAMFGRIRRQERTHGAQQQLVRVVRALTGFDRVMLYQFASDGSGTVVAEATEPGMEPFLGLRFPATDIPQQAREMYKRNLIRLIGDVNAPVHALIPPKDPTGAPLDMTYSVTRAVSPIHLEYLRNMGVQASMSVSILRNDDLWGLIACHHQSPIKVDFERRTEIELLAQLFSYDLAERHMADERSFNARSRELHDALIGHVAHRADLMDKFDAIAEKIGQAISCDGIALYSEGRYVSHGAAPSTSEFQTLLPLLNRIDNRHVFSTDHLADVWPEARDLDGQVAGLMALPISRSPRDFIVLFRQEIARSVRWAGNPEKSVQKSEDGMRLSPRKSFAAWTEIVKDRSSPWTPGELQLAEHLRVTLLEVVLKVADETNRERRIAHERQELLIAELNHRVRNILNLIRGVVTRSERDAETVTDFSALVDGRIAALARAHDQLTEESWGAALVSGMIQVESGAFLDGDETRVRISGLEARLMPDAFSTMALVLHELVTNSVKYGALSVPNGHIEVEIAQRTGDALSLDWLERGGPRVAVPERRGFGTTLIEKSVPYELGGSAQLDFNVDGVRARFEIPSRYVKVIPASAVPTAAPHLLKAAPKGFSLSGHVLLVEDSLVIGMDAEDMLRDLGADDVVIASNVGQALALMDQREFDVAVLDVNLGIETSEPVAKRLSETGVPFILATGYNADQPILGTFPQVPVVRKPYNKTAMRDALAALADGKSDAKS